MGSSENHVASRAEVPWGDEMRTPDEVAAVLRGALGRQVPWEKPPRDAAAQHIEDRIHDRPHGPEARTTILGRRRQERLDQNPFGIGQIGFVTQPYAAMLPPSGWGPHRRSVLSQ